MECRASSFVQSLVTLEANSYVAAARGCRRIATIHNAADASSLTSCKTLSSIVIATDAPAKIDLPGIETITAGLRVFNVSALESLSAKDLKQVDRIILETLPMITSVNLESLGSVDTVFIENAPKLSTMEINNPLQDIRSLTVGQTAFESLDAFKSVNLEYLYSFANPNMNDVSLQVVNVSGQFLIQGGGEDLAVNMANLLRVGGRLILEGVHSLDVPDLTTANDDVFIIYHGDELSFPSLQTVRGQFQCKGSYTQ